MPVYKSDKKFGAIISLIPPFNILVVPLLPWFIATTKPHRLMAFNRVVLRIFYFPIAIVSMLIFTVVNVALTPFAYIYALIHKVIILIRVPSGSAFLEVLVYLVFGLLFHALNILVDGLMFFRYGYDESLTRVQKINYGTHISKSAFDIVRKLI